MPDWKQEIRKRLQNLKLSPAREAEIVEELAQHLEDIYQKSINARCEPGEAYRSTLAELADHDLLSSGLRPVEQRVQPDPIVAGARRSKNVAGDFMQDVRFALRMLTKNPGFTTVAVIALALGIGANSAIFSVVNSVLLRPLPYKDPDGLVLVWEDSSLHGFPNDTPAPANFADWRDQNQVFEGMAALSIESFNLTDAGDPERLDGRRASGNLFTILGVPPQLGRTFTMEEDKEGANRVVVLSYPLWQRRFAGDAGIIGRSITLNGQGYTVIGVMPAGFQFPMKEDELWLPMAFSKEEATDRTSHYLKVVARLKPGMTVDRARAEMNIIGRRLQQQYPESNTDVGVSIVPLQEDMVGDIRPALIALLGAVALVLLIACANVANLLLARAAARQKEIAVRGALGADRWRLVRQFLTESVLLAIAGGLLGLVLSVVGVQLFRTYIPQQISQVKAMSVDFRVLGFTVVVSLVTGLVFGLVPAIQASMFNPNEALKEGGREATAGHSNRISSILVIAEVAISLVLLIGAGLLINSFIRLRSVDGGFNPENLLTMKVELPPLKYPTQERRAAFYTDLISRVETLPGVQSAAVTTNLPLYRQGNSLTVWFEGRPDPPPGQEIIITMRVVSPEYLSTMEIPLLRGRFFTAQDTSTSPNVVVVSETMAKHYWPNEDAIGKRICPGRPESPKDWMQVVGIAKDVRQYELSTASKPQMYVSYQQIGFFGPRDLVVRTTVDPTSLADGVRRTVWSIDKGQPVSNIRTMNDIVAESVARQRFSVLLFGIFAAVALVLAAIGIYGVMSYSVTQRRGEIGIRMALGAQKFDVLKVTVGRGLRLVLIGVGLGIAGSFALTRLLTTLLFGVGATDTLTFAVLSAILIGVAVLATYIPARRATKVDPLVALRSQ